MIYPTSTISNNFFQFATQYKNYINNLTKNVSDIFTKTIKSPLFQALLGSASVVTSAVIIACAGPHAFFYIPTIVLGTTLTISVPFVYYRGEKVVKN